MSCFFKKDGRKRVLQITSLKRRAKKHDSRASCGHEEKARKTVSTLDVGTYPNRLDDCFASLAGRENEIEGTGTLKLNTSNLRHLLQEILVKALVREVDTELLEAVGRHVLETKDVQNTSDSFCVSRVREVR